MRWMLAGLIVFCSGSELPAAANRPNIVLVVVDDLGWRDLGCYGSSYYRTPHIDRLAERGVMFRHAYAACAVCSPTRAALLTGKSPARLMLTQWLPAGRWDARQHRMAEGRFLRSLPLEEVTLAEALRETGYHTWHVGKWHLGGSPFSSPLQHGFDANIGGSEHGAPGSYFFPYRGTWTVPTTGAEVVKQTLPDGEPGEYLTDRLTDEALALLRERAGGAPFFLHLAFYAVHTPLQGKPHLTAHYAAVAPAERQGKPAYAAMVECVDHNVGRLLRALDTLGLTGETIVVLTSDNGGFAGATDNSPLRANKGSHFEGGIRVPLIIAGPGVTRGGSATDTPAHSCDLYPTLLDLAGLPALPHQHADGASLAALLTRAGDGGSQLAERSLFWHYPHYNRHPHSSPVSVVRRGPWKLIESLESGNTALFHLGDDPAESRDLARQQPARTAQMLADLRAWREGVRAEPMTPNPQFRPATGTDR